MLYIDPNVCLVERVIYIKLPLKCEGWYFGHFEVWKFEKNLLLVGVNWRIQLIFLLVPSLEIYCHILSVKSNFCGPYLLIDKVSYRKTMRTRFILRYNLIQKQVTFKISLGGWVLKYRNHTRLKKIKNYSLIREINKWIYL